MFCFTSTIENMRGQKYSTTCNNWISTTYFTFVYLYTNFSEVSEIFHKSCEICLQYFWDNFGIAKCPRFLHLKLYRKVAERLPKKSATFLKYIPMIYNTRRQLEL